MKITFIRKCKICQSSRIETLTSEDLLFDEDSNKILLENVKDLTHIVNENMACECGESNFSITILNEEDSDTHF